MQVLKCYPYEYYINHFNFIVESNERNCIINLNKINIKIGLSKILFEKHEHGPKSRVFEGQQGIEEYSSDKNC